MSAPEGPAPEARPTPGREAAARARLQVIRAARLARLRLGLPAEDAAPAEPPPAPAAVLPFHRPCPPATEFPRVGPRATGPDDLEALPGAGPGLVWALQRAGIARRADLAELAPEDLAARLGPLGRLIPAGAWTVRAVAPGEADPET